MPTVSVAIQAHPSRAEMAEALLACLDGQAEIVYDPEPAQHPNPWRCYRRALLQTPPEATHRLVVQDDVLVCDGFLDAVGRIAAAAPDRVVALFVGGHPFIHSQTMQATLDSGSAYFELTNLTWIPVVATLWPAELCVPLVTWADRQFALDLFPVTFTADDEICGRYLRHLDRHALATAPSLVEHPDTEGSLVRGHRHQPTGLDWTRRAAVWIGDLGICDAREINWARP